MSNKKYVLIETDTKEVEGKTLFRIKAKMSFGVVSKGELGGYIEKEANLSVYGNAWVSGDAWVYGNARVSGNAWVSGNARVYGNAWVSGNAGVSGDARVYGNAWVSGDAWVYGNAWVSIRADITTRIDFEIPRIRIDSQKKLDTLMKVLNELKE